MYKHPALLRKFVPKSLELSEHVPGYLSVGIVTHIFLKLLRHCS